MHPFAEVLCTLKRTLCNIRPQVCVTGKQIQENMQSTEPKAGHMVHTYTTRGCYFKAFSLDQNNEKSLFSVTDHSLISVTLPQYWHIRPPQCSW